MCRPLPVRSRPSIDASSCAPPVQKKTSALARSLGTPVLECFLAFYRLVDYKAFYTQLLKSTSPEFFRTSLCHIMGQLTMKVLGFEAGQAFSEFNRLILQDGSSFAL